MPAAARPVSIRRIIGAITTTIFGSIAVYFAVGTYHLARQAQEAQSGQPMDIAVDLSRPGVTEAPFSQTCQIAHGESILLRIADPGPEPDELLAGLQGKLEIRSATGQVVDSTPLPSTSAPSQQREPDEGAELAYFAPFELGQYTLHLEVDKPAVALADHEQHLHARYRACGLEGMMPFVPGAFAVVAGLPALIVGGLTLTGLIRHGWRSPRPSTTTKSDTATRASDTTEQA